MKPSQQWLLIVWNGRSADVLLHRMGLRPSRKDASTYIAFYALGARPQLLRHIQTLKQAGLHGIARKVARRQPIAPPARRKPTTQTPSPHMQRLIAAHSERDKQAAQRRKTEIKRQLQHRARADTEQRARNAILRAKGEL